MWGALHKALRTFKEEHAEEYKKHLSFINPLILFLKDFITEKSQQPDPGVILFTHLEMDYTPTMRFTLCTTKKTFANPEAYRQAEAQSRLLQLVVALSTGDIKKADTIWNSGSIPINDLATCNVVIKEPHLNINTMKQAPNEIRTGALHIASYNGEIGSIEWLLVHGASTEALDMEGKPPLCLAMLQARTNAVKRLLAAGANINAAGLYELLTPFHIACQHGWLELAKLCAEHKDFSGLEARSKAGQTPLMKTIQSGNVDLIQWILTKKPNVNGFDANGNGVLHILPFLPFPETRLITIYDLLIRAGAEPLMQRPEIYVNQRLPSEIAMARATRTLGQHMLDTEKQAKQETQTAGLVL